MKTIFEESSCEEKTISIGKNEDNDIVIASNYVSAFHAKVIITQDEIILEDLNSSNGTYVNGLKIVAQSITFDDNVTLGKTTVFDLSELREFIEEDQVSSQNHIEADNIMKNEDKYVDQKSEEEISLNNNEDINISNSAKSSNNGDTEFFSYDEDVSLISDRIKLDKDVVTIGRDDSNDIILQYPQISRHHAMIKKADHGYTVHDLQSTNGTFVNGKKIENCKIQNYDEIQLGSVKLVVTADGLEYYDQSKGVRLDVIDAMQQNGEKIYLHEISLSIFPKEFVGLLAPAGAGKSTFIETIIGIRKPTSGQILINNSDLHENFDSFRQWIGYVPQDDIIHKELTVRQCLYYAARLRLALDEDEINNKIDEVLEKLELSHVQHTQIGGNNERVSGGQRKRVNLGVELLAEPGLLFFDEPTTGLDPRTEKNMMTLFRKLADQGRTIVVITHSMESLDKLDSIMFLSAGGSLSYYGPAKECKEYFKAQSAADIFTHLQKEDAKKWNSKYKQSKHYKNLVQDRLKNCSFQETNKPADAKESDSPIVDLNQAKIFFERNLAIKLKDIRNTIMLLAQAPIIAILLTLGFERVNISLLLTISLTAIFFGCVNSCREIVGELPIFKRELMLNLNIWSYLIGKVCILAGFCFIQCIIFLTIIYSQIDMGGKPLSIMFPFFMLTSMGGIFLGLFISSIADTQEKAMTCVPIALLPQIIFAGALFRLENISEYISYITISRWSLEALREIDVSKNAIMLILICISLIIATYIALKRYDINKPEDENNIFGMINRLFSK
ncbi:maltooligosyl trehalose synthase [Candidatus Magnetomorum sp. HK-1]|nr:maltooligosyl trehalose synthase [Candidatus Magnetomorum sp. HK-1]